MKIHSERIKLNVAVVVKIILVERSNVGREISEVFLIKVC